MTISKIEALVDAIATTTGAFHNPESEAYKLRSPLLVRSFARPGKHEMNVGGRRVFTSMLAGYRAAVFDIEKKLSGESRAGIRPTDVLSNLLAVYEIHDSAKIVSFLRRALQDQAINSNTPLTYFRESEN